MSVGTVVTEAMETAANIFRSTGFQNQMKSVSRIGLKSGGVTMSDLGEVIDQTQEVVQGSDRWLPWRH